MDNLFGKFDLANKKHIMIDIETLSTKANAVIYEIAAIEFRLNLDDDPINGNTVFADKIIDSQINIAGQSKNRDISSSTMAFHFEHNMKNFVQFISNMHTCNDLSHVLKTLAYELNRYSSEDTIVWTNSPIFDLVILRNAYESEGIEIPAILDSHWNQADVRFITQFLSKEDKSTIFRQATSVLMNHGVEVSNMHRGITMSAHRALHDCLVQALIVKEYFKSRIGNA